MKYCAMAKSRKSIRLLLGIERSLSQKRIIKVNENIPIQPQKVHKVLSLYSYRTEQNGYKLT